MVLVFRFIVLASVMLLASTVSGETVKEAFAPPEGYSRVDVGPNDFGHYLREVEILPESELVRRYDQEQMTKWPRTVRVIDMPFLFNSDLEQCADVLYRLYADYARSIEADSLLEFRLQNGQSISWNEWKRGNRLQYSSVKDRHVRIRVAADSSRESYHDFLRYLFYWAGTAAMKAYLPPIDRNELRPGDMIVQNTTGGVGHVSIILDKAVNESGESMYLIANGWTPAQTPFIWRAGDGNGKGYWFTIAGYRRHMDQFKFGPFLFRSFR